MKLYKNYCIRIDLEAEIEIRSLANLITYGITLAGRNEGFYLPQTAIAFGKDLLDELHFQHPIKEGTNNENN